MPFVASDLATGAQLAEIPFRSFSHTKTLGGPGSWSASLEHDHPAISGVNARRIDANRRAIFVIDDHPNVPPLFGGILRQPSTELDDQGNEDLTVGGDGLWGWLRGDGSTTGRFWTHADHTYTAQHVVNVIASLWGIAAEGGSIALELATSGLGPNINLTMLQADAANFGTTVEQLATDWGVQFDTDYEWASTGPGLWVPGGIVRFQYPRRGRDLNVTLEHGVNCDKVGWTSDGFQQADQVIGLGAGALRSVATSSDLDGYPLIQALLHRKDITSQTHLDAATAADLAERNKPLRTISVAVRQDARGITPRTMDTGDTVWLDVDDGIVQEHGERWRVDSVQTDYDTEGQPTITVALSSGTINSSTGAVLVPGALPNPRTAILSVIRQHGVRVAALERS